MSVRTALQLINRVVDAYLNASDDELDADTWFCLNWFDQYGWSQGKFGQAEVLATAKGTTVERMKTSGVLESGQEMFDCLDIKNFNQIGTQIETTQWWYDSIGQKGGSR